MAVTDRMMHARGKTAIKYISVPVTAVISQTALAVWKHTFGYPFQVTSVHTFCSGEAGTVSADVQIGTTSVLASAPAFTAGTEVTGTLGAATVTVGTSTQALSILYTSNGTGTTTNGHVVVGVRPLVPGQGGSSAQP